MKYLSPNIDNILFAIFKEYFLKLKLKTSFRLLQKSQIFHGLVIKCLTYTIEESIEGLKLNNVSLAQNFNDVIISLRGCFENFSIAVVSLKICLLQIFKVVTESIEVYCMELL